MTWKMRIRMVSPVISFSGTTSQDQMGLSRMELDGAELHETHARQSELT